MQSDDEEGDAGKAEGEAGIGGVVADGRIPAVESRIEVVEMLQSPPELAFKRELVGRMRTGETGDVGGERVAERR